MPDSSYAVNGYDVYQVQPAQGAGAVGYEVKLQRASRATRTNITGTPMQAAKDRAIEIAEELAEDKWRERDIPSKVLVRNNETGEFYEEETFGPDPAEVPG